MRARIIARSTRYDCTASFNVQPAAQQATKYVPRVGFILLLGLLRTPSPLFDALPVGVAGSGANAERQKTSLSHIGYAEGRFGPECPRS